VAIKERKGCFGCIYHCRVAFCNEN